MASKKHILLVDDDTTLTQTLADQLVLHDEFAASVVGTGQEALAAVRQGHIDIVILDVGLPDTDGREVCRQMRRQGAAMPVIMLTASDSDSDEILGLEAGANDYVAKPFRFNVLLARIRAQLRQHEQSEDAVFTVGRYTFQPGLKLLVDSDSDAKIRLTEKETAILRYLYRAGKDPVSRDVLLNEVWGYNSAVTTHTLETHIYRLRQKIEKDPARASLLVTDKGGYRLLP
jgi:DNA-binding response OmpR family regulator